MTWFLGYWLIGESLYSLTSGLSRADLVDLADMLEEELRHDLESRRPIRPEEWNFIERICFGVAVTVFFLLPLAWPLVLLPDSDDDLLQ